MATTLTAATLTVTLTEAITLNGQDKGATNTLTIGSIAEVDQRIVTVPTTEVVILAFGTAVAAGQFIEGDVRYIRITNKDDVNFVTLTFRNDANNEFAVKLDFGQSFIVGADLAANGGVTDYLDASATAIATATLDDLVDITAISDTAAVDLELFVASV